MKPKWIAILTPYNGVFVVQALLLIARGMSALNIPFFIINDVALNIAQFVDFQEFSVSQKKPILL